MKQPIVKVSKINAIESALYNSISCEKHSENWALFAF